MNTLRAMGLAVIFAGGTAIDRMIVSGRRLWGKVSTKLPASANDVNVVAKTARDESMKDVMSIGNVKHK